MKRKLLPLLVALLALIVLACAAVLFIAHAGPVAEPPAPDIADTPEPAGIADVNAQGQTVVEVATAAELVNAIAPDTCVVLREGTYDLSTMGGTLLVADIRNLTLMAAPGAIVELVTSDPFAEVICFERCDTVSLVNIVAGHSQIIDYECDAGVVSFRHTDNITVSGCYLYGSGAWGLDFGNCDAGKIENTVITDCSLRAVSLWGSRRLDFYGCKFIDNRAYLSLIYAQSSIAAFTDCEISGNKQLTDSLVSVYGGAYFKNCRFTDNMLTDSYEGDFAADFAYTPVFSGETIKLENCLVEKGNFRDYWYGIVDLGGNTLQEPPPPPEEPLPDGITMTRLKPGNAKYQQYFDYLMQKIREREEHQTEYSLPNGDKIVEGEYHLYLHTAAGEEILLIEGNESYGEGVQGVRFYQMLDDYRFIYVIYGWEWVVCCGLYDTREFLDNRFEGAGARPLLVADNTLYSIGNTLYGGYTGEFNLSKTDLTTFQTKLLLENIPEDLLWAMDNYDISPDGKLFAISSVLPWTSGDGYVINIFSLASAELLYSLPIKELRDWVFYAPSQLLVYNYADIYYGDGNQEMILIDVDM